MSEPEERRGLTTSSSLPKLDPTRCHNLLSRVGAFLPQLQAANQALCETKDTQQQRQLDVTFVQDNNNDDGEGSSDSGGNESDSDSSDQASTDSTTTDNKESDPPQSSNNAAPMIQLEFAVGPVDDHPAVSLLLDEHDSDDDNEQDTTDHTTRDGPTTQKRAAIQKLLTDTSTETRSPHKRRKGPLITEIS